MAKQSSVAFICLSFILASTDSLVCHAIDHEDRKTYIVYMGSLPKGTYSSTSHHLSILQQVIEGGDAGNSLVRSYRRSFNGFAAKLTNGQRDKLAQMEGVVSVFQSRTLQTQTTRSWNFMGFLESIKRNPAAESEVIVGVIDTGIWPESHSFNDEGFGPVPKKWRGTCAGGKNFTCNKKIVGARYYTGESARDEDGHGTHTASTVAGNKVHDASFYGIAQGTARGGVPSARIAVYAACGIDGVCKDEDILSAFDDAISDGVDIISISLGNPSASDFIEDSISVGSFHAMEKGILTVQSGGNNGPDSATVSSVAPWILTVAASSTDRRIIDKVILGNGESITGNAVNSFGLNGSKFPIAVNNGASANCSAYSAEHCDCFDKNLVKGKIVLCPRLYEDTLAMSQGLVAGIITQQGFYDDFSSVVPYSLVALVDYDIVHSYKNTVKDPKAEILRSEIVKDSNAPQTVKFSSRGPNTIVAEILKPDISAPGVEILAAFSPVASPSDYPEDKRAVKYNILSGTSMACPHISGIAAYLKTFHPDWSPAAIKSAIMTTAKPMNGTTHQTGEFEHGFGHVNPEQAVDPGLVYDISKEDYIQMLCNFGYNASKVKVISGENSTCVGSPDRSLVKNINYPALSIVVQPMKPFSVKFNRTVTNVGFSNSTYKATVLPNSKMNITVTPGVLFFKSLHEKKYFHVTIVGAEIPDQTSLSSSLVWSDGTHNVRSPIVVMGYSNS